ncbi:sigma 54-interacting transcriptional regulator [Chitinophaga sp.]|uniref:sigma 54-interacting transcriptional regulator n=1 Tax=Chitinophaga sp. TaxID=1869181 RepID=UPI0031CFF2FC
MIEDNHTSNKTSTLEHLLSLSHHIAGIKDKGDLLHVINEHLKKLFYFSHSATMLVAPDRQQVVMYLLDPLSRSTTHPEYSHVIENSFPPSEPLFAKAIAADYPIYVSVREKIEEYSSNAALRMHYETGIREIAGVSLRNEKERFGVLAFYSDKENSFPPDVLRILDGVASQISIAISNIMANEQVQKREREKAMLLSLSYEMAKIRDKQELLTLINTKLKEFFYFTHTSIARINEDRTTFTVFLTDTHSRSRVHPDFQQMVSTRYPIMDGIFNTFLLTDEPTISDVEEHARKPEGPRYNKIHFEVGLKEAVSIPLPGEKGIFGVLTFYSDIRHTFTTEYLPIIKGVASQIAIAVSNILANEEVNRYRQQLEQENMYLQEEIGTVYNYTEMIGNGPAMQKVYRMLDQVSYTGSTVLIMGETGTGKELIARAIHNGSPCKDKLMIKVNCAALPSNLIESELFGHEKGSFTGAIERRIGKFELANNSTLFLDEIGEMPPELQAKLLRVIQEKEIERIGGRTTIKVNVRIIAATNRNLQQEVADGRFRSDLYYRLNVFPIVLPSLRERKEDLVLLIAAFIERFSRNAGKKITGVSSKAMKEMMAYHWPGNVRELEHLIERCVLLTDGPVIKAVHLPVHADYEDEFRIKTIHEVEREYIVSILKRCKGKIQGIGGAAELLNIPPTTLHSKMKKLGIKKKHFYHPGED